MRSSSVYNWPTRKTVINQNNALENTNPVLKGTHIVKSLQKSKNDHMFDKKRTNLIKQYQSKLDSKRLAAKNK